MDDLRPPGASGPRPCPSTYLVASSAEVLSALLARQEHSFVHPALLTAPASEHNTLTVTETELGELDGSSRSTVFGKPVRPLFLALWTGAGGGT